MQQKEISYNTPDGQAFYAYQWSPEQKPKAVLCLVHGFGEHIHRYEHVAKFFVDHQIALVGFDLRGHGRTEGKRGIVSSYDQLMDDISFFIQQVKNEFPDSSYILYGHSMGGNLALNYLLAKSNEFEGAIITSPWLSLASPPPSFVVSIAKFIGSIFPNFTVQSKLDEEGLSRDLTVAQAYKADPYVHGVMGTQLFTGVSATGKSIIEKGANFSLPMLLMHGNHDTVTSHKSSQQLADKANENLLFKEWDEARHELHNETNQEEVMNYMLQWVEENILVKKA
ncbi:alpha/beta hydrolase [Sediminitomix flava]|uniref:Monoacylglycerol lipase n=1 Tax=Sediminitomix flava TaxID=379075 RepID=A0A315ZFR1_SEDFL|nr:alpha/beta hydrolase [Sediminitomix flava]PWJ44426.1 alpha-beta hydrolase superfamily lysophospholipase [Sediminitomix flava]